MDLNLTGVELFNGSRNIAKFVAIVIVLGVMLGYFFARPIWYPIFRRVAGKYTVRDMVDRYGSRARARLAPFFERAHVSTPPKSVALVVFKREEQLELWSKHSMEHWKWIRSYPLTAMSGQQGPKLRRGDQQIPEGMYRVESLNPNSSFHLALRLDYPNAFDQKMAQADQRSDLGSDIMIHGKSSSVGCVAIGDEAIEELFVLANDVAKENVQVIIVPRRPSDGVLLPNESDPPWTTELYAEIYDALCDIQGG